MYVLVHTKLIIKYCTYLLAHNEEKFDCIKQVNWMYKALSTLERHEASPCVKFWLFHYDAMKLRRASHRPVEHGGADASWSLVLLRIDSWSK